MSEQKQVRHSCPIPLKDQTGKEPVCPFCTTTEEETISITGVCKGNGGNGIVETITRTEVCDNSFVREVKLPTAWYEEWNKVADFMAKAELYKISVVEGKVLVRVPPQLIGAPIASLDDIQSDYWKARPL